MSQPVGVRSSPLPSSLTSNEHRPRAPRAPLRTRAHGHIDSPFRLESSAAWPRRKRLATPSENRSSDGRPVASPRTERSMLAICRGAATGYGCGRESGGALSPMGWRVVRETLRHAVRASVGWVCGPLHAEAAASAWCLRRCVSSASALRPRLSAVASAAARSLSALSWSPGWSRRSSVWA
jgi:hypothetical protein